MLYILEKLLSTKSLETITPINENTIEAIVREVNVLVSVQFHEKKIQKCFFQKINNNTYLSNFQREPVISSVTQNKCDELCAIYHMVECNLKEREREKL